MHTSFSELMEVFGLQSLFQDFALCAPSTRQEIPASPAVAILTLALGIGANTAIFQRNRFDIAATAPLSPGGDVGGVGGHQGCSARLQLPQGVDSRKYQRRATTFSSISAYTLNAEYNVAGAGVSDRAYGSSVSTRRCSTRSECAPLSAASSRCRKRSLVRTALWCSATAIGSNALAALIRVCSGEKYSARWGRWPDYGGRSEEASSFPTPETTVLDAEISFKTGDIHDLWAGLRLPRHGSALKMAVQPESLPRRNCAPFMPRCSPSFRGLCPTSGRRT